MKQISIALSAFALSSLFLFSCGNDNGEKEGRENKHEQKEGDDHGHHGHHGPKDGKRPPRGGDPVQTKTLEEIGGYQIGDVATDFSLKNTDGSMVSLAGIENAKGYIVVFTCNGCPFSKMYEDRLIDLHNKYAAEGYSVIAINPNNPSNESENYEAMKTRAKEKGFPFAYLFDPKQEIYAQYGAVRTPHVFLLDQDRKVQYIGTIDDNAKSADDVKEKYLENAIEALKKGELPKVNFTKAIGCPVKAS